MKIFFLSFILLSLSAVQTWAWTTQHRWELSSTAQGRQFNQSGLSRYKEGRDVFFFSALDWSLKQELWLFEVRPELRLLNSNTNDFNEFNSISIYNQDRFMKLQKNLIPEATSGKPQQTKGTMDFEKLSIRYQGESLEGVAGRNPFNPSLMRLSPVWNKFSKDLFSQGLPNFQFNPDIISMRMNFEKKWLQTIQVNKNSSLLFVAANFEKFETQAMLGKIFDEESIGFNLSYSSSDSLYKVEYLKVFGSHISQNSHNEGAFGYETTWNEYLSTVSEIYCLDLADQYSNPGELTAGASTFSKLRGKSYFLNQIDYQASANWIVSFQPIINFTDSSVLSILSAKNTVADNLELIMAIKAGGGDNWTEFSSHSVRFANGATAGITNSAYIMLKYFL